MPVDVVLRTRSAAYRHERDLENRRGLGIVGALHLGWRGLTTAERSANARKQLRDKFGRFVEMGGPVVYEHGKERGAGTFEGLSPDGDAIVRDRSTSKLRFVPVESLRTVMARTRLDGSNAREEDILDLDDPDYLPKVIARLDRLGVGDSDFDLSSTPRGAGYKEMGYEPRTPDESDHRNYQRIIDDYYEGYLDARKDYGLEDEPELTKEEFVAELASMAASRYQGNVVVAAPIGSLAAILLDGSIRSQFETGKSRGFNNPALRRNLEEQVFGVPRDLPDRLRLIYASIESGYSDTLTTGNNYGELAFTVKDEVKERTTATGADSLDEKPTIGAPMVDTDNLSEEQLILSASETILVEFMQQLANPDYYEQEEERYAEAQIHGGLPISDVDRIELDETAIRYNQHYARPRIPDLIADEKHQETVEEILRVFGFDPEALSQVPGSAAIIDAAVAAIAAGENPYTAVQEALKALAAALGHPLDLTIY